MVTLKFLSLLAITIAIVSGILVFSGIYSVTSTVMSTGFAIHPLHLPMT